MVYLFLTVTILLLAAGQLSQKIASRCLVDGLSFAAALRALLQAPSFWVSGLLLGSGLLMWLTTLSMMEVSRAYPILSLSFVLTAFSSKLLLAEQVSRRRWLGIAFVTAGAALMLGAP
jgi:uncharacterized membrane protein